MFSVPLHRLSFQRASEHAELPIRIRPVVLGLNVLVLVLLGLLGFVSRTNTRFHPSAQNYVYVNDKVLHFLGFLLVCCPDRD